jgi:hypothetical protein
VIVEPKRPEPKKPELLETFNTAEGVALLTVMVWEAGEAAVKVSLPLWLAVTTTVPAPVNARLPPLMVAGPVAVKTTARPELALASSASGPAPYVTAEASGTKVIACAAGFTVMLAAGEVAALKLLSPV